MMLQAADVVVQPGRWRGPPPRVFAPDTGDAPSARVQRTAKILIVEDDHLVAIEAESALLDAGYEVVGIAATSREALAIARVDRPDLVVMDIRLAGTRDGVDTAIELFAESGLRSIFASAHSDGATRNRAQAAHPLGWLSKPYQPKALVGAVHRAISELGNPKSDAPG
jgi:two-component system, response regulator PdtaR